MSSNLLRFIIISVILTAGYLALGDLIPHLPDLAQTIASLLMILLFFYIVFNLIIRIIYRMTGVTDRLMFKGWSNGWPRPTHHQAAKINRFWVTWLGTSLITFAVYTLLFHRLEWKGAFIFGVTAVIVVTLAKLHSRMKIAGHAKNEIFK